MINLLETQNFASLFCFAILFPFKENNQRVLEQDMGLFSKKTKNNPNLIWLILLVIFTPMVGLALNRDVFTFRSVLLLLMWTVVLLIPFVLTQKKWLYVTAASLLFVDGFINLFHWILLKCPLNASSIFVFLNTNFSEASEFMTIKMTPLLLLFIPYIALFVITLKRIPKLSFRSTGEIVVWLALWLSVALFFTDNIVHNRFLRLAVPDVERAVISFFKESEEYSKLKDHTLRPLDAKLTTDDPTLVVVVIGESCNRNHMSGPLHLLKNIGMPMKESRSFSFAYFCRKKCQA